jgi:ankyrin repeat protein
MHVAAAMGHLDVVKLLLDTGASIHASNYVSPRPRPRPRPFPLLHHRDSGVIPYLLCCVYVSHPTQIVLSRSSKTTFLLRMIVTGHIYSL